MEEEALSQMSVDRHEPIHDLIRDEQVRKVRAAIADLSELDREVVLDFYFDSLLLRDISEKRNCPIGTVKRRLFTARNRLRTKLEEMMI
ncbi:hypothetical protein FJZ28_02640 [Candidatus Peregrinibacteria bacterium]|nr:hypothetical protein [Candidatus Peregrinibacteria bacterium]